MWGKNHDEMLYWCSCTADNLTSDYYGERCMCCVVLLDVFVGQLKSALTCLTCGYVSNTFDPFLDLSLPIPKVM